ncbi:hypothetical protein [Cellulomonas sp. RIT-PI-Y]|uniref:hypothetical protein n=1 Tax=Cellulomonas sp. RIT-PI-Y TaxID=3035297 RepID=UPI0021D968D8|nr:hypothetical protein [Cellulomonas sp. RIT-PI-Y]
MQKKKRLAAAAVVGLSLALSGVGVGVAQADNSVTGSYGGLTRITVSYTSSSNTLAVRDIREDGYGGRSIWSTSGGSTGVKDNSNGNGTTTTTTIPGSSGTIAFNACVKNNSTTIACTGYVSSTL